MKPPLRFLSQCHSVPHFKLPLLGSGHRIVSAPLVRCGTLTEEPSLISNLCFSLPIVLTCATSLFTDHLRSHLNCCGPSVFVSPLSVLILHEAIHCLYWASTLTKTPCLERQHPIQVFVTHTKRGLILAIIICLSQQKKAYRLRIMTKSVCVSVCVSRQ